MKNSAGPSHARRALATGLVAALALALAVPAGLSAPLAAQNALFPPMASGGQGGAIRWEVSVEPLAAAPGGEVSVIATYDIASPWYIYAPDHDPAAGPGLPMELAVDSASLTALGKPTFPAPKIKNEPLLDAVYRILEGKGSITQRYRVSAGAPPGRLTLNVTLKGQRCDPSVCLPVDFRKTLELTVTGDPAVSPRAVVDAASETSSPRPPAGNILAGGDLAGGDAAANDLPAGGNLLAEDPVEPAPGSTARRASHARWEITLESDQVDRGGKVTVIAKYRIDPGWHIYAPDQGGWSMPTAISSESEYLKLAGRPTFPPPKIGRLEGLDEEQRWLEGEGTIRQSFVVSVDAPPGPLSLPITVDFQTCTEKTCEIPEKHPAELAVTVSTQPPLDPAAAMETADEPLAGGDDDLAEQPLWLFILAMIGGGLFALAMPCTYPMIPITISYFTKQAEARHGAVLPLALAYGAGIIVIFNVIGILFAGVIQDFAFHWGTNLFFCLAFVVFALSLFGLYDIRLPTSINLLTGKVAGMGGYLGVFLLGTVLVVTSFTCTAPVMGGLLILAVNDGGGGGTDFARVSLGMTVFGATLAVPFVLLSLFPARVRSLPRSGEWMHVLKVSLGYLELAAAIKFLSNVDLRLQWNVLPRELFLLLWAGIFVMGSLYVLNVYRLDGDAKASIGPKRMLAGLCTLLLGLYFFWGSLGYQLDWITSALAPPYSAQRVAGVGSGEATNPRVTWTIVKDDIEGALARAKAEGRPVLVNFTGHL